MPVRLKYALPTIKAAGAHLLLLLVRFTDPTLSTSNTMAFTHISIFLDNLIHILLTITQLGFIQANFRFNNLHLHLVNVSVIISEEGLNDQERELLYNTSHHDPMQFHLTFFIIHDFPIEFS